MEKMNRVEFINVMMEALNSEEAIAKRGKKVAKKLVIEIVDEFLETLVDVIETAEEGEGVNFTGYFSAEVVKSAERKGRNLQTGEEIPIPEGLRVKLTPRTHLKQAVKV